MVIAATVVYWESEIKQLVWTEKKASKEAGKKYL